MNPDAGIYSVFVGGSEVNDYLMTFNKALLLAFEYTDDGYDDVYICNTVTGNFTKINIPTQNNLGGESGNSPE